MGSNQMLHLTTLLHSAMRTSPKTSIRHQSAMRTSRLVSLSALLLTVAWIIPTQAQLKDGDEMVGEFCATETFNASCKAGQVILMTHAYYGRMRRGRCVTKDYGSLGCAKDVIEKVDARCSGRRQCEIHVPDADLDKTQPCPNDLKPYLDANYKCVTVETAQTDLCHGHRPLIVTNREGYLASLVTEATGCGGHDNPWSLRGHPGQHIRLILYDFEVDNVDSNLGVWPTYVIVRETQNISISGQMAREQVVYTSASHILDISVVANHQGAQLPHFLLKYQVVGCADPVPFENAQYFRNNDELTIKCNFSQSLYQLKCVNNEWRGQRSNCSEPPTLPPVEYSGTDTLTIPYGLSIVIVLAIALLIGLFVLFVGLLFLRRQRGMCFGAPDEDGTDTVAPSDALEKEYVRNTWRTSNMAGGSQGSLGCKAPPWREGDYHVTYPCTELPPCTPLMDREHKPPLYGQLGQKLPCGCPSYITGPDADYDGYDYDMDHAQSACAEGCAQAQKDKVVIKPGEATQYFVLDPRNAANMQPPPSPQQRLLQEGKRGTPCPGSVIYQPRPGTGGVGTICGGVVGGGNCNTLIAAKQQASSENVFQETDDLKLRALKVTDIMSASPPNSRNLDKKPLITHSTFKHGTYTTICKDKGPVPSSGNHGNTPGIAPLDLTQGTTEQTHRNCTE